MVNLVLNFHSVNPATAPQYTLPVQVGNFGNYYYKGADYGDIEFPSAVQDQQVVDEFLGLGATSDTMTGTPLPAADAVTVSVLNGSGAYNQATDTAFALKALGFQIANVGDSASVGAESETVVSYSQLTPAAEAAAQSVARSLSGAVVMAYEPTPTTSYSTQSPAEVTVTTGTEYAVNAPAPAASPTTTAGSGASTSLPAATTTTTAPAAGSSAFAPTTPAVEPLQPWDPRSCTASGGEGP